MDRGSWQKTVNGVIKNWRWLRDWKTATMYNPLCIYMDLKIKSMLLGLTKKKKVSKTPLVMGSSSESCALFHPSAFLMFYPASSWCFAWQLRYRTERKMVADNWEQRTMAFYIGCVLREQEYKKSSGQLKKRRRPRLWNPPFWTATAPRDQMTLLLCGCTALSLSLHVYRLCF